MPVPKLWLLRAVERPLLVRLQPLGDASASTTPSSSGSQRRKRHVFGMFLMVFDGFRSFEAPPGRCKEA